MYIILIKIIWIKSKLLLKKERKEEKTKRERRKKPEKFSKNSFIISTQSTRFYCTRNNSHTTEVLIAIQYITLQ